MMGCVLFEEGTEYFMQGQSKCVVELHTSIFIHIYDV